MLNITLTKNSTIATTDMEQISDVIAQLVDCPDLDKLEPIKDKGFWKDQLKAVLNLIPGVGGGLAQELQNIADYRLSELFRKFTYFILELTDVSAEERVKFSEEIQDKAKDYSGNVILGMVDRLDSIRKQKILANLVKARIHQFISIEDFFRMVSMLERIPCVDLEVLPNYKEPFYDESGDTELLYATGALMIHTIDANETNKYILSKLGEGLLKWGCLVQLEIERNVGTNMALNYATDEDVDRMFEERKDDFQLKWNRDGDVLDDDAAQFEYDKLRGK